MAVRALVIEAERRRLEAGMTQDEFATKVIKVSPGMWSLLLKGRRNLRSKVIKGIVSAYPDLRPLAEQEAISQVVG